MLMRINLFSLTLVLGTSLVGSKALAADYDLSKLDIKKLPPVAAQKGVTYEKDIKPILEKSCVKCHGEDKPKSKYRLDSREAMIKGGKSNEAAVVPGKSDKSPIVFQISDLMEDEDLRMPPTDKRDKYPPLTKDQIGLIRAWIDQGAK